MTFSIIIRIINCQYRQYRPYR